MTPLNVLISLHKGYGLGDAVQMSAVLRHVVKARPHWIIDYQAPEGQHQVGRGIVANTFAYGDTYPSPHYDAEVQILLFDTYYRWTDRPNTRVSSALLERFGLDWSAECGRYEVNISREVCHETCRMLDSLGIESVRVIDAFDAGLLCGEEYPSEWLKYHAVAYHYQGDSSKEKKDLTHEQAEAICEHIRSLRRVPLKLGKHIPKGYDAEANCAIISQCEAFIGIDSGPAKCASATDTPALVVWTGHHPAVFHDPAPNTTHLVPVGYHKMEPVCGDPGVIRFFEENYNVRTYSDSDPIPEVKQWLTEVLK